MRYMMNSKWILTHFPWGEPLVVGTHSIGNFVVFHEELSDFEKDQPPERKMRKSGLKMSSKSYARFLRGKKADLLWLVERRLEQFSNNIIIISEGLIYAYNMEPDAITHARKSRPCWWIYLNKG